MTFRETTSHKSEDRNVRLVYDTGLWGSELSGIERHLRRQRGLDLASRRTSLSGFRWQRWCKSVQGRGAEAFLGQRNSQKAVEKPKTDKKDDTKRIFMKLPYIKEMNGHIPKKINGFLKSWTLKLHLF